MMWLFPLVRSRAMAFRHRSLQPPFGSCGPARTPSLSTQGMAKVLGGNLGSYLLGLPIRRPYRDKLGQVLTAFRRRRATRPIR